MAIAVLTLTAITLAANRNGGSSSILGVYLGVGLSLFSVITLGRFSAVLTQTLPHRIRGIQMTVLLLILKLPVFLVAIYFATQLPMVGVGFFLAGVAVVYSCTVWFLAWSPNRDNRT